MNLLSDTKAGAADWMRFAACRDMDPNIWYPNENTGRSGGGHLYDLARSICAECPVIAQCDAYANSLPFAQAAFGMFAGVSPRDRRNRRARERPGFDYGPGTCRVCGIDYTKRTTNSVLCGAPECVRQNNLDAQRRHKERKLEAAGAA